MPYIGNVITSFAVETGNINDQAITAPKLSATGGTDGQVLALAADLSLEWVSDPAGQWVTSGSNIYYNDGNVGIGNDSPSNNLDIGIDANSEGINIGGSGNFFGLIQYDANRSGADQAIGDIAYKWNGTRVARIIGGTGTDTTNKDDGALQFHTASAGSATEKVRIDGAGRLLIGTSSSFESATGALLQIKPGSNVTPLISLMRNDSSITDGNNLGQIAFYSNDGSIPVKTAQIDGQSSQTHTSTARGTDIVFSTTEASTADAPTERLRIDSSGRVGIGTASPSEEFVVRADAPSIQLESSNASGRNYGFQANNDGNFHVYDATAGENRITLDSSGRLLVGETSTSVGSTMVLSGRSDNATGGSRLYMSTATTTPANGSQLGGIYFSDDSENAGAVIEVNRDGGTWTSGSSHPSRITFATAADGASSPTERMRIDSSGRIGFGGSFDLTASNRVSINPDDGLIGFGMNGRESYVTGTSGCYIYSGSGASGTTLAGELILQARSNVDRSIKFITGTTPDERARIDTDGLKFHGDTAAANALDDYEEGSFTPAENSVSLSTAAGLYTKVGRMVHVQIRVRWPTTSNATAAEITGLPFSATTASTNISNGSNASGIGYVTGGTIPQLHMDNGSASVFFYNGTTQMSNANLSGVELRFGIMYSAA